jgi:hypothetical protein
MPRGENRFRSERANTVRVDMYFYKETLATEKMPEWGAGVLEN